MLTLPNLFFSVLSNMKFSVLHLAIARQVALPSLQESEESCKKRNELHTDEADTATSHELLDSLALSSR